MSGGANGHADFVFSTVRGIADGYPTDTTFREFMAGIRDGKWRAMVEQVRATHDEALAKAQTAGLTGKAAEDAVKDAVRPLKTRLPGACFSGTFSYRDAKHLKTPSGLICADLDHLNERVEAVRDLIVADPHTLGCVISPSGTGLKVIFRIDPSKPHIESFRAAESYVRLHFGEEIDAACKEINRLCFVSYDPDAFIADTAEILPYPPPPSEVEAPAKVASKIRVDFPLGFISPGDDYNARGDWQALVTGEGWKKANEPYWTRPGKESGISASWDVYPDHFHVFTDSAPPLKSGNYRPFALYAFLRCGGDFQRASDELYEMGFGTRKKPKPSAPDPDEQARIDAENEAAFAKATEINLETPPAAKKEPVLSPDEARKKALQSLRDQCYAREFNFATPPPEPIPRFLINGAPVSTPGNITSITAQSKTGKSSFLEAMIAAVIAADLGITGDRDTLGVTACAPNGKNLIHFDTEQSRYDHDQMIRRALRRAGATERPPWLRTFCVTGFAILDCRRLVSLMMGEIAKQGGMFATLIDGVADLAVNVNDPEECNPLVAEIHELAINFDCPIVCNLHENPGQDVGKGRGHLGSQIERKAESNLRLRKADDVITVFSEKMRRASIMEKDGPRFSWSHSDGMHMSCRTGGISVKDQAKIDRTRDMRDGVYHHAGKERMRFAELLRAISEVTGVGASAAEDRFTLMKKFELIQKDLMGFWSIKP